MTRLQVACGVDLGSTTSKAVLLDDRLEVIGRGITNSRSSYDVASAVARSEAQADARFTLLRRAIAADGQLAGARADALVDTISRAFRESQYRLALAALTEEAGREAATGRFAAYAPLVTQTVTRIFAAMDEEAGAAFQRDSGVATSFFRDLASSAYARLATELSDRRRLPFDMLMGIFDKAILVVENTIFPAELGREFNAALRRNLEADGVAASTRLRVLELVDAVARTELVEVATVGTGYGRARLPFPKELIRSEILCHGLGAHAMFPGTATVLDIGGQDTKAIQVDPQGIVTSFHMNDRCAAGCGRYLGYIADEMNLGLHELGPLAMLSARAVKINSTCTVFAGAELRERLSLGQRREDILAGLHRAIILRAMSLLARAGGVFDEFTFTGGVARNPAAVAALVQLVEESYGKRQLNISPASIYTGALGAALFAWRSQGVVSAPRELVA